MVMTGGLLRGPLVSAFKTQTAIFEISASVQDTHLPTSLSDAVFRAASNGARLAFVSSTVVKIERADAVRDDLCALGYWPCIAASFSSCVWSFFAVPGAANTFLTSPIDS